MADGPKIHRVQRLRVASEPAGSFAVDIAPGSHTDVPFIEGTAAMTLTRAQLPVGTTQQFIDNYPENVLGLYSASLSFQMVLAPTGTAAGDGVTAKGAADGRALAILLKGIMGTETLAVGDTAGVGSTATAVVVTTASRWDHAYPMGWSNTSSILEVRPIDSESGSTETMKLGFSGAPSSTNPLYAGAIYTLDDDPDTSFQFIVEGDEDDDYFRIAGAQGSFTLEMPLGELPKITFTFQAATWEHIGDRGADISAATYSHHSPVHFADSFLLQYTNGTNTYSATTSPVHASTISVAPAIQYVPIKSPSGTQTIYRWRRNRSVPVMGGSFTTWFEGYAGNVDTGNQTGWGAMRDARTDKGFLLQIGSTAGGCVFLEMPTCQITDVQRVDDGGIAAQTVSFICRDDNDTGTVNSDFRRSPFRLSFL